MRRCPPTAAPADNCIIYTALARPPLALSFWKTVFFVAFAMYDRLKSLRGEERRGEKKEKKRGTGSGWNELGERVRIITRRLETFRIYYSLPINRETK